MRVLENCRLTEGRDQNLKQLTWHCSSCCFVRFSEASTGFQGEGPHLLLPASPPCLGLKSSSLKTKGRDALLPGIQIRLWALFFVFSFFNPFLFPSLPPSLRPFFFLFHVLERLQILKGKEEEEERRKCKNASQSDAILFRGSKPGLLRWDNYSPEMDLVSKRSCSFEEGKAWLIFSMRK